MDRRDAYGLDGAVTLASWYRNTATCTWTSQHGTTHTTQVARAS